MKLPLESINGTGHQPLPSISGLSLYPNVLTPELERDTLAAINDGEWIPIGGGNSRRIQQFGSEYIHKLKRLSDAPSPPIPYYCIPLIEVIRLKTERTFNPTQLIINEYTPGQGIGEHVDAVDQFGETIVALSLGSGATMKFKRVTNTTISHSLWLPPRSALIMTGEARYDWKHGISKDRFDFVDGKRLPRSTRVSLTFREAKG
jgi:hypothetical protein